MFYFFISLFLLFLLNPKLKAETKISVWGENYLEYSELNKTFVGSFGVKGYIDEPVYFIPVIKNYESVNFTGNVYFKEKLSSDRFTIIYKYEKLGYLKEDDLINFSFIASGFGFEKLKNLKDASLFMKIVPESKLIELKNNDIITTLDLENNLIEVDNEKLLNHQLNERFNEIINDYLFFSDSNEFNIVLDVEKVYAKTDILRLLNIEIFDFEDGILTSIGTLKEGEAFFTDQDLGKTRPFKTYDLVYEFVDSSDNKTEVIIHVELKDLTPPKIKKLKPVVIEIKNTLDKNLLIKNLQDSLEITDGHSKNLSFDFITDFTVVSNNYFADKMLHFIVKDESGNLTTFCENVTYESLNGPVLTFSHEDLSLNISDERLLKNVLLEKGLSYSSVFNYPVEVKFFDSNKMLSEDVKICDLLKGTHNLKITATSFEGTSEINFVLKIVDDNKPVILIWKIEGLLSEFKDFKSLKSGLVKKGYLNESDTLLSVSPKLPSTLGEHTLDLKIRLSTGEVVFRKLNLVLTKSPKTLNKTLIIAISVIGGVLLSSLGLVYFLKKRVKPKNGKEL